MNRKPLMSKTQNICLVLLCILFVLLTIIIVKEQFLKKKENGLQLLSLDERIVQDAISYWQLNYCEGNDSFIDQLYSGNYYLYNMTNKDKLFLVIANSDSENLSFNEINSFLAKAVGSKLSVEEITEVVQSESFKGFSLSLDGSAMLIKRDESRACDKEILINYASASSNEQELRITFNFAYSEQKYNDENFLVIDYYKDIQKGNVKQRLTIVDKDKITWDDYDVWQMIFIMKDGKYILNQVKNISVDD